MFSLTATLATAVLFAQDDDKRDLSGENDLKALFATYGKYKSVHYGLVRFQANTPPGWEKEGNLDFWYKSPSTYRSDYNSIWNDSTRYITDGKTLSIDSGNTVTLRNAPNSIFDRTNGSRSHENGGVLLQLLAGPKNYEKIVSSLGDITSKTKGNQKEISFRHTWGSEVTLLTQNNQVQEIWYVATIPTFNGMQRMTIRDIVAEFNTKPRFSNWLFNTTPSPIRDVEDLRDQN